MRISIPVENGFVESDVIKLRNGILQGDSYCPDLYVLTMNVASWVARASDGYKMSAPIEAKITHTLFIDDLKGYAKSRAKLIEILNLIQKCMKDAGLIWNGKKCKFVVLKRGKFIVIESIILADGTVIKCLAEDENYKFMGVPQRVKMDVNELGECLLKTIQQRSHIVWSSMLSDRNKSTSTNMFINSVVEYYFWAVKFPINVIKDMDVKIRHSMNTNGAKHTNLINGVNYLRREQGGRGLRSLEDTYKATKIKVAVKLADDTDPTMKIVRRFHELSENTTSFSIFKDAKRYASEIGVELNVTNDNGDISGYDTISKECKTKTNQHHQTELMASTWQGLNFVHRLEFQSVTKSYFNWMSKWKSCPTNVVQEFYLLFYQLLPTKQYQLIRSKETVDDTRCRICKESPQESVKHLISNCSAFAKQVYITRHDSALKCFVWPVLKMLGLVEKCPVWYAHDKVQPYYQNERAEFWWDIPEYTGRETESERPVRPDGKLRLQQSKEIFLIEMTVPWMGNRDEKLKYKVGKYDDVQATLRYENPEYTVDQITLVIDVFGGYGRDLVDNIGKVVQSKRDVEMIVSNMQKSVISNCANLSRAFKLRSKGR